jgi:HlyD family secretion protein
MTDDASPKSTLARSSKPRGHASRKRWISRGLWALVGLGLIAATVFAFLPKPIPVEVATVERGLLRVTVDEAGKTRVIDRYVVSAPLAGHMARIELHPGDRVEVGTLLATLEPVTPPLLDARTRAETEARLLAAQAAKRQADAAVGRAKLAEEFASNERDRIAGLVSKGSLSSRNLDVAELELRTREQELVSARFGVRVAVYQVEVAKAALKRIDDAGKPKPGKPGVGAGDEPEPRDGVIEVRSAIAGRVLRVLQEHEGVVQLGTPLVELADPSALEVVVDVLTTDAVQIRPGDPVILRDWGGREPLSGRVRLIEPSAFTKISALGVEEQRVNVIIDLDKSVDSPNPASPGAGEPSLEASDSALRSLGDGYRVEVSIIVWEGDDVLLLPVSALFRAEGGWAVWKLVDGHARLQAVEIGQREGLQVEVLAGLAVGDQVVIHPSDAVVDGVAVEVE